MSGTIGVLDWDACNSCIHSDEEEGGCAIEDSIWEDNLQVDYDFINCGMYEEK